MVNYFDIKVLTAFMGDILDVHMPYHDLSVVDVFSAVVRQVTAFMVCIIGFYWDLTVFGFIYLIDKLNEVRNHL